MVSPSDRRRAAEELQGRFKASERRACRVLRVVRSTKRRKRLREEADRRLVAALHEESERYPRWGYRKIWERLKAKGYRVGRERLRLLRREHGLRVVVKQKKRKLRGKSTAEVTEAKYPNHIWSYDFVSDQLADGRRIRVLTVLDEYTRESLCLHVSRHITSRDVRSQLQWLFHIYGKPECLRSDNGPEFVAKALQRWLREEQINTRYIEPGSPWQNPWCESFNGVFRDGCLDRWLFIDLREARAVIEAWRREYNEERPHGSLGGMTPSAHKEQVAHSRELRWSRTASAPLAPMENLPIYDKSLTLGLVANM